MHISGAKRRNNNNNIVMWSQLATLIIMYVVHAHARTSAIPVAHCYTESFSRFYFAFRQIKNKKEQLILKYFSFFLAASLMSHQSRCKK